MRRHQPAPAVYLDLPLRELRGTPREAPTGPPGHDSIEARTQITTTIPTVIITTLRVTGGFGGGPLPRAPAACLGGRTSAITLPTTNAPAKAKTSNCNRLVVPPKRSLAAE